MVHEAIDAEKQDSQEISKIAHQRITRRKYISWNAAAAAQAEIIEYLEELIDLVKLLVGAREFRSGLLTRPSYADYIDMAREGGKERDEKTDKDQEGDVNKGTQKQRRSSQQDDDVVPASLKKIRSKKSEGGVHRRGTNKSWNGGT